MLRLQAMALALICVLVVLFAGCYKSVEVTIEVGESGPFKPTFIGNYAIIGLDLYHVYGWPRVTPSNETANHEPVWRTCLTWSAVRGNGDPVRFIKYGELPSGYSETVLLPLEKDKLYLAELQMGVTGPSRTLLRWFCILEDESGEARLIELTFRDSRYSDSDQPFNEIRLELEEGTGKILKIIPVK